MGLQFLTSVRLFYNDLKGELCWHCLFCFVSRQLSDIDLLNCPNQVDTILSHALLLFNVNFDIHSQNQLEIFLATCGSLGCWAADGSVRVYLLPLILSLLVARVAHYTCKSRCCNLPRFVIVVIIQYCSSLYKRLPRCHGSLAPMVFNSPLLRTMSKCLWSVWFSKSCHMCPSDILETIVPGIGTM